jgi:hypothetical protein
VYFVLDEANEGRARRGSLRAARPLRAIAQARRDGLGWAEIAKRLGTSAGPDNPPNAVDAENAVAPASPNVNRVNSVNGVTGPFPRTRPPASTATLRAAYRRWFELTVAEADGQRIAPAEAEALHQVILKLTDEAGPAWADAVFADELRRFRSDTGRCGLCGGLGHPLEDAGA